MCWREKGDPKVFKNFACRKYEKNIRETVEQERLDALQTVRECTYLCDRVSAGGGCEAVVTVRTRCWLVMLRECSELVYGKRFSLRLKDKVYKNNVSPALYTAVNYRS